MRSRFRPVVVFAVIACMVSVTGCGVIGYGVSAIVGESVLLLNAGPIDQALADPDLTDSQRSKLQFVLDARDFGQNVVGLNVGGSYQNFVNLHGKPLAWNLSASRKDRFEPYIWDLLLGRFPYLGFFNEDQANAERDRLVGMNYDTVMYEVDAYSTLGLFPDPVTSALLNRDLPSLADTVLHELTHNTISKLNDANFNETLATFVGRAAALEFLAQKFGEDSNVVKEARDGYEDSDRMNAVFANLVDHLNVLYNSDKSSEEKIAGRVGIVKADLAVFATDVLPLMHDQAGYARYVDFPINNSFLLLNVRYNDGLDVFQRVHDLTGHNWAQSLQIFSDAAAQDNPLGYLRGIVDAAP